MTTNEAPEFTRHTCCPPGRGPAWGRKTPGCPRCDELLAGAAPREAHPAIKAAQRKREQETADLEQMRRHFRSGEHLAKCQHGNPTAPSTCYDW